MNGRQLIFLLIAAMTGFNHDIASGQSPTKSSGQTKAATQLKHSTEKKQIQQWVKELGAADFRKRELAALGLSKGGVLAASALIQAVDYSDLEVTLRARKLLSHLLKSHDPPADNVSIDKLTLLARDQTPSIYRWALKSLARQIRNNDKSKYVTSAQKLLKNLANGKNREVARIALEILYPTPPTFDAIERLKRIVIWEQKIRRCQQEIADITTGENKNRQGPQRANSLRDYLKTLEAELSGYCEDSLLRYRIKSKYGFRANEIADTLLIERYLYQADFSTSRLLIAKAITKRLIQGTQRKIEKYKKSSLSQAAQKFNIKVQENDILHFEKYLRFFEAELTQRGVTERETRIEERGRFK